MSAHPHAQSTGKFAFVFNCLKKSRWHKNKCVLRVKYKEKRHCQITSCYMKMLHFVNRSHGTSFSLAQIPNTSVPENLLNGWRAAACQCERGQRLARTWFMGAGREKNSPHLQFPSLNTMGVQVWVWVRVKWQVLRMRARVEHVSKSKHRFYFSFWSAFTVWADAAWFFFFWHIGVMKRLLERRRTDAQNSVENSHAEPHRCPTVRTPHSDRKSVCESLGRMIRLFAFTHTAPLGNVMVAARAWKKLWSDIWWVMSQGETSFHKPCSLSPFFPFLFFFAAALLNLLCWNAPKGIFSVLQVCFDHKPRIISKTNKDEPSICSHPVTKHDFENHKWVLSRFHPFATSRLLREDEIIIWV